MAIDINTFTSAYTAEQIKQALEFYRTQVAEAYDKTKAYHIDDYVIYEGLLYQSKAEIAASSAWDASKWEVQKVFDNEGRVIFKTDLQELSVPLQAHPVAYTGSDIEVELAGFKADYMVKSGTYHATDVGTYTATISLINTNKYKWSDGTTTAKNVTWSISKATVALPVVSDLLYTYDGTTKSATVNYDTSRCTLTGNSSGINAGNYTFTISLNDTTKMQWADNTTEPKSYTLVIERAVVSLPSLSKTTYFITGSLISPEFVYDSSKVNIGGTYSAIAVGNYTATFTLKDSINYLWHDSTVEVKSINWSITDLIMLDNFKLEGDLETLELVAR